MGAFFFSPPLKICLTVIEVSFLGPVTTPEHQLLKTPSSSSLSQRVRSTLRNTPRYGDCLLRSLSHHTEANSKKDRIRS